MTNETEITPIPPAESGLFAVFAEIESHKQPLFQLNLTFSCLMDDIVVPYSSGNKFFIDGAPVKATELKRIKILHLNQFFNSARDRFDSTLTRAEIQLRKVYGEQYSTRFEHMLRENSDDVTAQVIKAYEQAIEPKLKEYLLNRKELISAALTLFITGLKALNS